MSEIKIKSQKLSVRCEICHQGDSFDPFTETCNRCKDLEEITKKQPPGLWLLCKKIIHVFLVATGVVVPAVTILLQLCYGHDVRTALLIAFKVVSIAVGIMVLAAVLHSVLHAVISRARSKYSELGLKILAFCICWPTSLWFLSHGNHMLSCDLARPHVSALSVVADITAIIVGILVAIFPMLICKWSNKK